MTLTRYGLHGVAFRSAKTTCFQVAQGHETAPRGRSLRVPCAFSRSKRPQDASREYVTALSATVASNPPNLPENRSFGQCHKSPRYGPGACPGERSYPNHSGQRSIQPSPRPSHVGGEGTGSTGPRTIQPCRRAAHFGTQTRSAGYPNSAQLPNIGLDPLPHRC